MNKQIVTFFCLALYGPFLGLQAAEQESEFSGRMRLAGTEVSPDTKGASASLRLRFSLASTWNEYFSSVAEIDHVTTALDDQFSNGKRVNGKPSIPDVEGLDLNQAALRLTLNDAKVSIGRERIELDDQRLVGGNSFWQNEQTFDGANLTYKLFSATQVFYSYIANVNRIQGDDSTEDLSPLEGINVIRPANLLGDHEHETHLLHINTQDWDYQELSVFYYDIDNKDAPLTSNKTLGFRHRFKRQLGSFAASLVSSIARQTRPTIENSATSPYYLLDAELGYQNITFSARYERLGKDGSNGFATPLSSAHDFHGWADKFTDITHGPFVDRSLQLFWRKTPFKFDARYHWFGDENSSANLGREFDLDVIYKLNDQHRFLVRYADYFSSSANRNNQPNEKRLFLNYLFTL